MAINQDFEFKTLPNGVVIAVKKQKETKQKASDGAQGLSRRRATEVLVLSDKFLYRRAFSTLQLIKAIKPEDLKMGNSIHVITAGNVDQLSYLELMILQQPINYCLISTWCMGEEDVKQIEEWIDQGLIKKMDFYVGEIFPSQYTVGYAMLNRLVERTNCGRIAVFRNHSKIIAGYGDKYPFCVETSANVNTNPRTEQGIITLNGELVDFYKKYFDGIKGFNETKDVNKQKENKQWEEGGMDSLTKND